MVLDPISPLEIAFASRQRDGRLVIASQRLLNELKGHVTSPQTADDFVRIVCHQDRDFLSTLPRLSMVQQFLRGMHNPQEFCENFSFDECVKWSNSFYILTPIPEGKYLRGLYDRLSNSKMRFRYSYDELVKLKERGLVSCSCSAFLRRAWCIHACVCVFKRKILIGWPQDKDPTPREKKGRGRTVIGNKRSRWEYDSELAHETTDESAVVDLSF